MPSHDADSIYFSIRHLVDRSRLSFFVNHNGFSMRISSLSYSASLLLLAMAIGLAPAAQAQPNPPEPAETEAPRTAYLVRSADMLPVVLMSARTSLPREADDGFTAAAADVVVVGPAVKALVADGPHAQALRTSMDAGVRVVACELAMEKTGTAPDALLDGIDTAPNGFHELFRLQHQGYETLQL